MTDLYLVAHIAGRAVAIATDQVDSVVDIGAVVPVPGAAAAVRGLSALRSRVVTVVDPRVLLGAARSVGETPRAVITRHDGHHYALLVDALEDVTPFEAAALPNGLALDPAWAAIARGVVEREDEPLLVIDLDGLIPLPMAA